MKYFLDTEFIEGFYKPLFGKRRHLIDLISIAIVAEDGREYYAISDEYKYKKADKWVQENVIAPMYVQEVNGDSRNILSVNNFHKYISRGKSNKKIARQIIEFTKMPPSPEGEKAEEIEFFGFFADYDWVLFCSLFGRMIDLPSGFPMYCRDLKQMLDEKAALQNDGWSIPLEQVTLEMKLQHLKYDVNYPKQDNEHNALSDAKFNYQLYKFIQLL